MFNDVHSVQAVEARNDEQTEPVSFVAANILPAIEASSLPERESCLPIKKERSNLRKHTFTSSVARASVTFCFYTEDLWLCLS